MNNPIISRAEYCLREKSTKKITNVLTLYDCDANDINLWRLRLENEWYNDKISKTHTLEISIKIKE